MAFHYFKRESLEAWTSPNTWKNFYLRRFFRIAPLYYVLLIFAFAFNDYFAYNREFINTVFPNKWFVDEFGSANNFFNHKYLGASWQNILLHVTFLFGLIPQYSTSTPLPDWSIGLEMQFYAVFPFLMLMYQKISYFWTTVIVLIIGSVAKKLIGVLDIVPSGFREPFPLPSFLLLKIDFFVIGILLAAANHYRHKNSNLLGCLVGLALLLAYRSSFIVLAVCVLIALMLFYDRSTDVLGIKRLISLPEFILSSRMATFMADTSYSVYLTHTLIMAPLAALLISFPTYTNLPGIIRFGLLFSATLPVTYSISWLLFKYIEKPGIWLGKKVMFRSTKKSVAT